MAAPQQPPAPAPAYPPKQIKDSVAIIDEILAELRASPAVQIQFVKLLSGLATHGGDKHAVGSRAADLLRGHPGVLRRFTAVVHTPVTTDVHVDEGLALTTPRRSRSRRGSERRNTPTQQTPAAAPEEAPPNVAAAARNHHHRLVDDGRRLRLADDDDGARALTFVKRVHETAGPVIHDRFLAVLSEAEGSEDMFADEIYGRAKRAFGPAHVGLLHAFATAWFPGEEEWKRQQQQQQQARGGPPARQRSRAAAAASVSHAGLPDAKTKLRADDDDTCARRHDPAIARRQRNRAVAAAPHAAAGMPDAKKPKPRADGGGNGRQHDNEIAVLEVRNVKKRRGDDDGTGRGRDALLRIGESSGGGSRAAPPQRCDDEYDYAPRSRAKKPRSGNREFSGNAAAAQVLGADATGVHHAYTGDNRKPPRRRAANGGKGSSAGTAAGPEQQQPERDDEVRRFRQEWEFQTGYSKLVATSDRVTELLPRRRTSHGDGDGDGGGHRSLEALFPLPECRDFLRYCYGDRWDEMRAALESGESRVPALEAIAHRLGMKEEGAIVEESRKRCRHDPDRVAQRLHGLAVATQLDEERRRHYHGGGA